MRAHRRAVDVVRKHVAAIATPAIFVEASRPPWSAEWESYAEAWHREIMEAGLEVFCGYSDYAPAGAALRELSAGHHMLVASVRDGVPSVYVDGVPCVARDWITQA